MTPLQQDPSAQAPWTRTMFGRPFICHHSLRSSCGDDECRRAAAPVRIARSCDLKARRAPGICSPRGADVDEPRAGVPRTRRGTRADSRRARTPLRRRRGGGRRRGRRRHGQEPPARRGGGDRSRASASESAAAPPIRARRWSSSPHCSQRCSTEPSRCSIPDELTTLHAQPEQRFWLLRDLQQLLERAALESPLLIAIDDAHWADGGTVAAIRTLPMRLMGLPIAWVIALRPPREATPLVHALEQLKQDGARTIVLGPLDDDAVAQLAADMLAAQPDQSILQQLAEADGSPFLVVETLLGLQEEDRIRVVDGRARADRRRAAASRAREDARAARPALRRGERRRHRRRLARPHVHVRRAGAHARAAGLGPARAGRRAARGEPARRARREARVLARHHPRGRPRQRARSPPAARSTARPPASCSKPARCRSRSPRSSPPAPSSATRWRSRRCSTPRRRWSRPIPVPPRSSASARSRSHRPTIRGAARSSARRRSRCTSPATASRRSRSPTARSARRSPPLQEAEVRLSIAGMFAISPEIRIGAGRLALNLPDLPETLRARHLACLFHNLVTAGRLDEARAVLEETRAAVESADDARATFTLRVAESALEYTDDRFGPSLELITSAYRDGIFAGDDQRLRLAHMWHGELLSVADRDDEAFAIAADGLAAAQRDRQGWAYQMFETWHGRMLLRTGRLSEALAVLEGRFALEDGTHAAGGARRRRHRRARATGDPYRRHAPGSPPLRHRAGHARAAARPRCGATQAGCSRSSRWPKATPKRHEAGSALRPNRTAERSCRGSRSTSPTRCCSRASDSRHDDDELAQLALLEQPASIGAEPRHRLDRRDRGPRPRSARAKPRGSPRGGRSLRAHAATARAGRRTRRPRASN